MEPGRVVNIPIARSGAQFVENDRPDLAQLVPSSATSVLDVGCGPGQLGAELKARGIARVVGIELNPDAARVAAERLDEVLVTDVETEKLPFADGEFDCIIYGDVLEHLVDPWAVLRTHRRLAAEGATIIVSTPNIGYWRVIVDLLRGRWEYRSYGTMDATHLRFFTRRSLVQLCEQAGLRVVRVHTSVPRSSKSGLLNRLTRGRLEHLLVWRYVIEATPAP
jgi:methionine biosynthesis protein MetW